MTLRALLLALAIALLGANFGHAQDSRAGVEFFEKKIRPVLVEHCYQCHSADAKKANKLKAELFLDSSAGLLKGGESGPAVVPGKVAEGTLLKALRHAGDVKMPPNKKLPAAVLADFETWVTSGAAVPDAGKAPAVAKETDWAKARQFWAFQPPVKFPPPAIKDAAWPLREIDRFVLAELEKRQLKPAGPATKRELLRRATFDLTGLPPTPEEMDDFLKDDSPAAYAKVVDRLLASPSYGERWARYWLDISRYAEDKALAFVNSRPNAYRYRDWVVQALNNDMPYDRFLRLQLAGDLLPDPEPDPFVRLAGLGFQGLGAEYHRGSVAPQVMADELDDRVDTLTRGLLGLTVACARCHDHKFDPIPTRDYYSLAAAYNGASLVEKPLVEASVFEKFKAWEKQLKDAEAKLVQLVKDQAKAAAKKDTPPAPAAKKDTPPAAEIARLKAEIDRLKKEAVPAPPMAHAVAGGGDAMRVNIRGVVERLGEPAPPGFLRVITPDATGDAGKFTRLELANAIASPKNPLTARVIVNRVWHYHFGRGIVGTSSNFGALGDRPTHPELLDTLAVRFVENGWSLRWLHREMMLSRAYQLSGASSPANAEKDAENQYLWRHTPQRLDLESWRDSWLAVSGRLDRTRGGPSADLDQPANVRRTLYAKISRVHPNALMTLFDFPDSNVSSDRRSVTTVPQQQLFALNSDFTIETAKAFAKRLETAAPQEDNRLSLAFRLAYGRVPSSEEKAASEAFLREAKIPKPTDRLTAWEQLAQVLLASNEFQWVD